MVIIITIIIIINETPLKSMVIIINETLMTFLHLFLTWHPPCVF